MLDVVQLSEAPLHVAMGLAILTLLCAIISASVSGFELSGPVVHKVDDDSQLLGSWAGVLCLPAFTMVLLLSRSWRWPHGLLGIAALIAMFSPSSNLFLSLTWQTQTYVLPFFNRGSGIADKLRIVPSHKLLFCAIEKNANTAFEDLLCSLAHSHHPAGLRGKGSCSLCPKSGSGAALRGTPAGPS